MSSKEDLKKIADEKNYTSSDSIINKILQDAELIAESGTYSMYIDTYFRNSDFNLKPRVIQMLKSAPYNFDIEEFSDVKEGRSYVSLTWS